MATQVATPILRGAVERELLAERDEINLESLKSTLECPICYEMLCDATEVLCCGRVFCLDCIQRWLVQDQSCPLCRCDLTFGDLWPSRHVQRQADELRPNTWRRTAIFRTVGLPFPRQPHWLGSPARVDCLAMTRFICSPLPRHAMMFMCEMQMQHGGHFSLYTRSSKRLLCCAMRRSDGFHFFTSCASVPSIAHSTPNFDRMEFTLMDDKASPLAIIRYLPTKVSKPRLMEVTLPAQQSLTDHYDSTPEVHESDVHLVNQIPVWNESFNSYCLDFGGRVELPSPWNFILESSGNVMAMLFGSTRRPNICALDFSYPLSPLQAFAIALSATETCQSRPV